VRYGCSEEEMILRHFVALGRLGQVGALINQSLGMDFVRHDILLSISHAKGRGDVMLFGDIFPWWVVLL
jgi:hypothetical protein